MNVQDLKTPTAKLNEGVIDRLRKITDDHQAMRVQFDDGDALEVDAFTASAIVALHNALGETQKGMLEQKIGKSKDMFYRIADFAFQKINENTTIGRGDILINEDTETVKMTEGSYNVKPKSSKLMINDQPYILINKPGIGETAYSVQFTKNIPILEEKEFEEGTRVHAGHGKKGGAGISGVVTKEENGYVFIRSDEGKNYKAPKEKVMPISKIEFSEQKKKTKMRKKDTRLSESKDYTAVKDNDGQYTVWTVGEAGSRQDVVKGGLTKSQAKKMIDKLYSKDMGLVDESGLDENAFNQAAAAAAKAGKKEFEFDGETYPVEMDKETAKEILEDSENVDIEQWIKQYKKREDNNMHSENVVELARLVGDDKHIEVAQKILDRIGNTGYVEPKVAKAQYNLHRILWDRLLEQYGDVYSEVELDESAQIDDEEGWTDKAVQDPGDYGPLAGAEMAKTQLHYIIYAVDRIKECMREGVHLPNWLQNKISSIHYDMQGIHSYMEGSRLKGQFGRQISEGYHVGSDYGPEAATNMARTQLGFIKYAAQDIINCTDEGTAIPEWYQNKIARLHRGMETVFSYMQGKRHSDVDGETEKTMDMATPASKPAPATGAAFFGGDEEEYIPEEKSKKKRRKKISESVQSDWDVDKRVQDALESPFTDPSESPEDIKRRLLSNRKKAEKQITQKVFVPINGALFALSDMLVHPRGLTAVADAYFGENEREFLKEIKEEIQSIHDKIEGSSVIDPD